MAGLRHGNDLQLIQESKHGPALVARTAVFLNDNLPRRGGDYQISWKGC